MRVNHANFAGIHKEASRATLSRRSNCVPTFYARTLLSYITQNKRQSADEIIAYGRQRGKILIILPRSSTAFLKTGRIRSRKCSSAWRQICGSCQRQDFTSTGRTRLPGVYLPRCATAFQKSLSDNPLPALILCRDLPARKRKSTYAGERRSARLSAKRLSDPARLEGRASPDRVGQAGTRDADRHRRTRGIP